jgi:hypothetical protein
MLASIAHDPSTETMEALFKREGLYLHRDISPDLFERVLHPGPEHEHSVGKAYNALIRGHKPSAEKLGKGLANGDPAPRIQEALRESIDVSGKNSNGSDAELGSPAASAPALPAEIAAVESKSTSLATQATEIKVVDPDTQVLAADMLITVAAMQTEIETTFKPMKDAAYKAHRVICQQETNLKAPLVAAEKALKGEIAGYIDAQNQLARKADEANRKTALEQAEREAATATIDQAIDQAIDLEARGNAQAAEAVLANPAPAPIQYQAPAPTRPNIAVTKGVPSRQDWDFQITDFNLIPREYLLINESAIRSAGKNTQGRIKIAGVEFFPKTIVATSRRG